MNPSKVRLSIAVGLTALFVMAPVRGHTTLCLDDGEEYADTCVGIAEGTPCIRPIPSLGCCDKGECTNNDICDLGGTGDDACDDGNVCTDDTCETDVATLQASCPFDPTPPGSFPGCSAETDCTEEGSCDGAGACFAMPKPDTDLCDDGAPNDICKVDGCLAGVCVVKNAPDTDPCDDGVPNDICTSDGCLTGVCVVKNDPLGDECQGDNDLCTFDECDGGGTCVVAAGGVQECAPTANQCTDRVCDPIQGGCQIMDLVNGTTCSDGKECSLGDQCVGGTCNVGFGGFADDGTVCREDGSSNPTFCVVGHCDGQSFGCKMVGNADSGTDCSLDDPDTDVCRSDQCDGSGTCIVDIGNAPSGTDCSLDNPDADVCTFDECNGSGTCVADTGGTEDCSGAPSIPCKILACDSIDGCVPSANIPDGTACEDGLDCTLEDDCDAGECAGEIIAPLGAPCRGDDPNDPESRTWCEPGTCDGIGETCLGVTTLLTGAECDPNPCTNATCQADGGQCLVASCQPPTVLCPNCGPGETCAGVPSSGDANNLLMCGCPLFPE